MTFDPLLHEQLAYYRARAGEYDEWFLRQGRYDRGPALNGQWFAEVEAVAVALDAFDPAGRVLELAGGTGLWTQRLVQTAAGVTVVDASPEMLALNRERVGEQVRHIQADLFDWRPDATYDVVFFSFWLSHVPPDRFDSFWDLVRACLAPGGRFFFIDSLYNEAATATDHRLEGPEALTLTRRLNDGREYRIVKIHYQPEALAAQLADLGWHATVHATANHFLYGFGSHGGSTTPDEIATTDAHG
jgi:demethylmenaquinone methyltransferase/2-methoxy-6-polyprenyl-1,4-benzoquinol methylase